MVERGEQTRFALKSRETALISGQGARQKFYRHVASELGIACAIHFAHPADAQQFLNLVDADSAGRQRRVFRGADHLGGRGDGGTLEKPTGRLRFRQ